MTQTLRQRRELRAVAAIGKPEPTRLVDGMKWNSSATHNTDEAFYARQVARGLVPKERKP